MLVREIMTKKVDFIDPEASLSDASKIMREDDVGCLPVGENDRIIGMITDRDIVVRAVALGKDLTNLKVRDVMSKPIKYCFEEDPIEDLAQNLAKNQVHRLPVLNQDKRLVGIVSLSDLSNKGSSKEATYTALHGICGQGGAHH
jgi:CBS domain-containing protein